MQVLAHKGIQMTHFVLRLVIVFIYVNFSVERDNKISYLPKGKSIQNIQTLKNFPRDKLPLEDGDYSDSSINNTLTRHRESSKSRRSNLFLGYNGSYSVPSSLILEQNTSLISKPTKEDFLAPQNINPISEVNDHSNISRSYPISNTWVSFKSQQSKRVSKKIKPSNSSQENLPAGEETPLNSTISTTIFEIDLAPKLSLDDSDARDDKLSYSSHRNLTPEENSSTSPLGRHEYHRISNSTEKNPLHGVLPTNLHLENIKAKTLPQNESLPGDKDPSSALPIDLFEENNHSMSSQRVNHILQVFTTPTNLGHYSPKEEALDAPKLAQGEGKLHSRLPKVFFLISTTTTKTTLTTVTRTLINTCYSTHMSTTAPSDFNLGPCNGRKRRKRFMNAFPTHPKESENESETTLDSTLSDSLQEKEVTGHREQRILTFWSTSRTTITVTTKSFLAGTTATVTVQCTIPNVITSPFCGFIHFD